MENKRKILHISHIQDLDGKMAPILTKILYPSHEIEVLLLNNSEMNKVIIDKLNTCESDVYEKIIITDLGINEEAFDLVANLQQKLNISFYDHHINSINNCKRHAFPKWAYVTDIYSATLIYVLYHNHSQYFNERMHLLAINVSDYDTFKFKENNNKDAERLNVFFSICSFEEFERYVIDYITHKTDYIYQEGKAAVLDYIFENRQRFIDEVQKTAKIIDFYGRKCAVSFTDHFDYVSELGYQICVKHPEIDIFMSVNPSNPNVQLRSRKEEANLYELAKSLGGGGHAFAAGFPFKMDVYIDILKLWTESNEYLM